jgi:hypothetical protein
VIVLDSDDESLISCQPEGDLNCDFDGDGKTDLISGDDRSWLDLDGSSANTNDLRAFITGDKETTIRIHTWVPKSSGLAASLYGDIYDQWVSGFDTYVIPVYADVCDQNPEGYSPPCSYNPDTDTIIYVPDTSRDYYYIVSFGLFRVTCVNPMGHSSSCDVFDYLVETYTGNSAPFENKTASVEGYYTPATSEDIDAILSGTYYGTSSYVIKLID